MVRMDAQHLPGDIAMQRIHKPPEGGLHRQLGDFQDAGQNRIASDETQLVQPGSVSRNQVPRRRRGASRREFAWMMAHWATLFLDEVGDIPPGLARSRTHAL
jgi:hypothetical protein